MKAGAEGHVRVKLPYSDQGSTIVRAWFGTEDRNAALVTKAEYSPDGDDYDVHLELADPLPEQGLWWIELEKPDGSKALGSIDPHRE